MRRCAILLACLVAGCASAPPLPGTPVDPERAATVLHIGTATRASVQAALGATASVSFDSGYQAWQYRRGKQELVLLFSPDGVLRKVRNGATLAAPDQLRATPARQLAD